MSVQPQHVRRADTHADRHCVADRDARAAESLGNSVNLGRIRRTSDCRVNGALPDRRCTPGRPLREGDCGRRLHTRVRGPRAQRLAVGRDAAHAEYGITKHFNGASGEVDHLVSLELGGSNAEANLFPEAATPKPGSHEKDRLENKLHQLVCKGQLGLRTAQRAIGRDWVAAYGKYVGPVPST